jgi:hypothetical protein
LSRSKGTVGQRDCAAEPRGGCDVVFQSLKAGAASVDVWHKVKEGALRGFVECADGWPRPKITSDNSFLGKNSIARAHCDVFLRWLRSRH